MKKALIILFIIMITLSGCANPTPSKENAEQNVSSENKSDSVFYYAKPLTLAQVTTTMMLEGFSFIENQEENANDYAINNVTPAIYTIKQNDNTLMIYIYKTIALRKEACWSGEIGYDHLSQLPHKENWITRAFTAKNVLIIDMCNTEKFETNTTGILVWRSLKAAADSLNDVKELVFTDKGSYWDASLVIKYYKNWYKDREDKDNLDRYAEAKWLVKYLGSDPKSLHHIKYEYKGSYCSGSGTGSMEKIGKDYYLSMFGSGGNTVPYKDDIYTLTIHWDGKKETLHLKRISQ